MSANQSAIPHLYTIPPSVSFLSELAEFIFERAKYEGGLHTLPSFKILLPSRRAVRALQFECLKRAGQKSMLMPRFLPIGDIDDEELDLTLLSLASEPAESLNLPPLVSFIDRRLWLTDLIAKKDPSLSKAQCLDFAKSLIRLMDQIHTENLDLKDLKDLVSDKELSLHWQQTVEFLDILSVAWPEILKEKDLIEPSFRRNYLLQIITNHWQCHPPAYPIIAAGSTGSIPAVARLLSVIAKLPKGHVILPSYDQAMPESLKETLPPAHPQSIMQNLVDTIGVSAKDIHTLNVKNESLNSQTFIREIMHPPAQFLQPSLLKKDDVLKIIDKINIIEAEQEREEALYIALILRKVAENPLKTAMVVTPDRNMARRISAELKRWNINVNDSAGQGLHTSKIAIFLKQIMKFAAGDHSLECLLLSLKLPFLSDLVKSEELFAFEQDVYRNAVYKPSRITGHLLAEYKNNYPALKNIFSLFLNLVDIHRSSFTLSDFIQYITNEIQKIIEPSILWQGQAGQVMVCYLQDIMNSETGARIIDCSEAPAIIEHFWSEKIVRDDEEPHPNITILGQIEARLLKADVMILSGLNEGIWPQDPAPDPWMSRPMRVDFGLPASEKQYALSAHDFASLLISKETYLTRSLRYNGAPTIKARWLQRLEAYLVHQKIPLSDLMQKIDRELTPIVKWLHQSDDLKMITPPSPQPSAQHRPHDFYVTDIERLIKNPYHFYVQSILQLRPLNEVDEDSPHNEAGTILHSIFEQYALQTKEALPENPEIILRQCAQKIKDKLNHQNSSFWYFFWEKLDRMLPSFIELDREWRQTAKILQLETKAKVEFINHNIKISLRAKADRIDQWHQDGIAIIDYKSGKPPSDREILDGRKPQLPLEMLMAAEGAFGKHYATNIINASFWCVPDKSKDQFEIKSIENIKKIDPEMLITRTREEFLKLVSMVINPSTPFNVTMPKKQQYKIDDSIHHLARSAEWGLLSDEGQDQEGDE